MSTKTIFTKIALSLLLLLGLGACGSESNSNAETTTETGPLVVTTRLRAEPDRLNPYLTARSQSSIVFKKIFPNLVDFDPQKMELSPVLAKALPEVTPITSGEYAGGVAYTMEIHEEAVWDNGTPVLASDYVFTLKMINNPKMGGVAAQYRGALRFIKKVEIDSDNPKKFTVLTAEPFISGELNVGFWIYPEYAYDPQGILKKYSFADLADPAKAAALAAENSDLEALAKELMDPKFSQDPAFINSCGAYRLEEWTPNQQLVLRKKENWWGEKLMKDYPLLSAYPDKLVYKTVPDNNAAITMVKNENIDALNAIPVNTFLELRESEQFGQAFNFFTPQTNVYNYIGINIQNPKLQQQQVRRALAHLLDLQRIQETVYQGLATLAATPIISSYSFSDPSLKPIPFDVAKAQALLKEAGWEDSNNDGTLDRLIDGKRVELALDIYLTPSSSSSSSIALIFQAAARKAGIKIALETMEFNKLMEARNKGDYELLMTAGSLTPVYFDPYQYWHTKSSGNFVGFGNADTDKLIEEIRVTIDSEKQKNLYKEFQKIIYDEQAILMINVPQDRVMIRKKFKNTFGTALRPGYSENYFQR